MTEVLLFSDDEKIFNLINSVIDGRYKLIWCTYKSLEKKLYPYPDIVIMYFDKEMVLVEALNALTDRKREVILLSYFMEMSDVAIARKMNLVRSTVHEHRTRSLELLKQIMEENKSECEK